MIRYRVLADNGRTGLIPVSAEYTALHDARAKATALRLRFPDWTIQVEGIDS